MTFTTEDLTITSEDENESEGKNNKHEFLIKMFGINEQGKTVALNVTEFKFLYIKVDDSWSKGDKTGLFHKKNDIGSFHGNI